MPTRRIRTIATIISAAALLVACKKDKDKGGEPPPTAPSGKEPAGTPPPATAGMIPITTKSEEARALYLEGNKLNLELRATDAHAKFEQAVAKDPDFALAHLGMANTAPTNNDFFTELDKAVALSGSVSEPEQLWIKGVEQGAKGDPDGAKATYTKLVEVAPADPLAANLLGVLLFGRQDYAGAIATFNKVITLDPKFTAAYNQLGYAYRAVNKLDDAERTFKQYIELLPNDPNPYDSYAELLMKRGKYDESIASYEKALAIDPNFVASYVGIGNNHMFAGRGDKAREAFAKLGTSARNLGEQRQVEFWNAVSYIHEGKYDDALAACDREKALAKKANDLGLESGDHNMRGNILLAAGKPDEAAAEFKLQLETIDKANVPAEVKDQTKRNSLYDDVRVALAKKDLATAKAVLADYTKQVEVKKVPFEVRQQHELAGLIAIEDKQFADAITELSQAGDQDPRVMYELGLAYTGAGDKAKAKAAYQQAYDFDALGLNYAWVRAKAKRALDAS